MPHKRKELKIEGPNLWYLVGLIASDGNLSSDGRHIDITSKDYEFLQGIKNLTGIENKIGAKYNSKGQKSLYTGWKQSKIILNQNLIAGMLELADNTDLKSVVP